MQTMSMVEMEMVTVVVVMVAAIKPKADMVNLGFSHCFGVSMIDTHISLFSPNLCC